MFLCFLAANEGKRGYVVLDAVEAMLFFLCAAAILTIAYRALKLEKRLEELEKKINNDS